MLPAGLGLDVVADGHGGEHNAEVSLDGVAGAVVDRASLQVVLGHSEGLLDAPQLVVGVDDERRGLADEVGGVTPPAGQGAGLSLQLTVDALGRLVSLMNRLRLTVARPSTARWALATCSSMPRRVRRARSCRYC